ncbi:MAG TPA: hypothetical protein VNZ26_14105 [Vicinamibacterales bacterium]|nr:hypothetical protein [Vicinamibacterales bacterium]
MTASPPPGLRQDVVVRYELLRQDALSDWHGASSVGLTLFLREGMAPWMRACASAPPPRSQPASAVVASCWSSDVRAQAASILAGILLSFRSETTPCMPTGKR